MALLDNSPREAGAFAELKGQVFTPHAGPGRRPMVTSARCTTLVGTAWARSGHRMGTKQKAAHWGGFRPIRKLLFLIENLWLRGQDLNLRPLGYEPNELPGCSTPRLIHKCSTTNRRLLRCSEHTAMQGRFKPTQG